MTASSYSHSWQHAGPGDQLSPESGKCVLREGKSQSKESGGPSEAGQKRWSLRLVERSCALRRAPDCAVPDPPVWLGGLNCSGPGMRPSLTSHPGSFCPKSSGCPSPFSAYTGRSQWPRPPCFEAGALSDLSATFLPSKHHPKCLELFPALGSPCTRRDTSQSTNSSLHRILGVGMGVSLCRFGCGRALPAVCPPPRTGISGTNKGHEEAYGSRL